MAHAKEGMACIFLIFVRQAIRYAKTTIKFQIISEAVSTTDTANETYTITNTGF